MRLTWLSHIAEIILVIKPAFYTLEFKAYSTCSDLQIHISWFILDTVFFFLAKVIKFLDLITSKDTTIPDKNNNLIYKNNYTYFIDLM